MLKMNKKALFYIFFLIIVIAFNVSAQQGFEITAQKEISICPCSNQGYPIYIKNNEDVAITYDILFSGSASGVVRAVPGKFSVGAGVVSYFYVYVNSACNTLGSYDLDVFIKPSFGDTKVIKQKVNFLSCYKYDVKTGNLKVIQDDQTTVRFKEHEASYAICQNQELYLPILIDNKEDYANSYLLSFDGPEWIKSSTERVELDGNSQGVVFLKLDPDSQAEGEFNLNLNILAELGNVHKVKQINFTVDKCYGLLIDIKKDKDIICGVSKNYDITIENDGKFSEVLELNTSSEIAKINNTLTLGGNTKRTVSMVVDPSEEELGIFDISVKGNVLGTLVSASDSISIDLIKREECFRPYIAIDENIDNKFTEEYYAVTVINNGLKDVVYDISIEAPSWVEVTKQQLFIEKGKKDNFNIHVKPFDEKEGDYDIALTLKAENVTYSKNIKFKLRHENWFVKTLKNLMSFYRYYILLLVVLVILIIIFFKPIQNKYAQFKDNNRKFKEGIEKQRQKEEEIRLRREERRKMQEERKINKEKEKQARLIKKAEKKVKKQKARKKFKLSFLKVFLILALIIVFAGLIYYFFENIRDFFVLYYIYVIVGIVLLIILINILSFFSKDK